MLYYCCLNLKKSSILGKSLTKEPWESDWSASGISVLCDLTDRIKCLEVQVKQEGGENACGGCEGKYEATFKYSI